MSNQSENISCAILAGGNNSRIGGKNKALINIGGSSIFEKITTEAEKIFRELIIVTNNTESFDLYKNKFSIITDVVKKIGPLGGIYSALNFTKSEAVLFIPCDMPFINQKTMELIINAYHNTGSDVIIPRIGKLIEPLHSLFKKETESKLLSFIQSSEDYSIRQFLKHINVFYLDLEDNDFYKKTFTNINSQNDLHKVLQFFFIPAYHE